jgi:hypothetical protein
MEVIERKQHSMIFYNKEHREPEALVLDNFAPEDNVTAIYYALLEEPSSVSAQDAATDLYDEALLKLETVREQYGDKTVKDAKWILIDSDTSYEPHRFNEDDSGELFAMMYFVPLWNKEWGGETIIFNKCEAVEVASCIPARTIIAEGNNWMRIAQPTKNAKLPIIVLQFKLV